MTLPARIIARLAARPGVRRNAVENFLGSLDASARDEALANLIRDARGYGWDIATVQAIREGIVLAFTSPHRDHYIGEK